MTEINNDRLLAATALIKEDDHGVYLTGPIVGVKTALLVAFVHRRPKELEGLSSALSFITNDLSALLTILQRLAWYTDLRGSGQLAEEMMMRFAAADVDIFHVEYRSLFDHVANVLRQLSAAPGQTPSSFHKQMEWLKNPTNRSRFGETAAEFVKSCDWFMPMCNIRNTIIHRGGFTIVFPQQELSFQIYLEGQKRVLLEGVMANENVVDFRQYAGVYVGYLLTYLAELGRLILCHHGLTKRPAGSDKLYHPGLHVLRMWVKHVLAGLSETQDHA